MRTTLLLGLAAGAMWACGGGTFVGGDGGVDGGSSSGGSGGSSGSSSGSSGGSSSGGGSGGGSGGASSSGSGGGTLCPASAPPGGACPKVGLVCEYGMSANPGCAEVATCDTTGWSSPPPVHCITGTCPTTYGDVPKGQTCSPSGLDCAYPQGQCNCARTVPVSGPNPIWQCSTPSAGCPEPRAPLGSACSPDGLSCDYGACTGGIAEQCKDGYWQEQPTACPPVAVGL